MSTELRNTPLNGLVELLGSISCDNRGAFFNAFRAYETSFIDSWGDRGISQVNLSRSEAVGTVRGLHFQSSPYSEAKLVRCLKGKVWDLAVDIRSDSDTYGCWHGIELSPEIGNALFIPEGFAHGFQVLEPGSELLYLHSGPWVPESEKGIRWNDPHLSISWPLPVTELSDRDSCLPFFND